jgi:sarcosine oxidase gamma subunit
MQRNMRSVFHAIAFAFAGAALAAFAGCSHPPDETRIRNAIAAMQEAAEARRASGVLDHVANDFTGQRGDLDRDGLSRLLKLELLRSDAIDVSLGRIAIRIDGDRAAATFDMTVADASRRWLPSGRETFAVVSGWRREGSEWVCYNATWTAKD